MTTTRLAGDEVTAAAGELVQRGVDEGVYPGAVWAVATAGGGLASGAAGLLDPRDPARPASNTTVYDVASLTKVMAVWAGIGALWEDGRLELDDTLSALIPARTDGYPLGPVTVRQLLTHTAGVPLRSNLEGLYGTDPDAIRAGVLHEQLHRPPGEAVEYTDRAALILGFLAEDLAGMPLDALAREVAWGPLGLRETRFGPLPASLARECAPTEFDQRTGAHLRGTVHDFSARLLGGVCGIAGAFSTVRDCGRFLGYLLALRSPRLAGFGARWVAESLRIHTGDLVPARGLFWYPAPGTTAADDIWVHYGFTGTGLWVSPARQRWAVLLTNKLYFSRDREPMAAIRDGFRCLAFG